MSNIKLLPEYLINQIAAGEVVERPASVVKELLENSLDAGAKRLIIEVEKGGDGFLRITDDGSGMDKDDALLAFERHATSKISTSEDLFSIHTLGFRGEAIASIAAVSCLSLQTKEHGEIEGTLVMAEGGKITKNVAIGAPEGTQIEVRNLFFNTPARKKYLKNAVAEFHHIINTVTGVALTRSDVAFKLVHDHKVIFDLPATEDLLSRVRALLGRGITDDLVPIFYGHSDIRLDGFIGKPSIARSSRSSQYLFVNGREVKSHVLSYAVKQSYHSLLPKEKYPVFLLYFTIDPQLVDVNVHPRKLEVRFSDEKEIFKIVLQACKMALEKHILAPKITHGDALNYQQQKAPQGLTLQDHTLVTYMEKVVPNKEKTIQEAMDFTEQFAEPMTPALTQNNERKDENEIIPLTQIANSYILCQQGAALIIVDQHAAHERIRYTEIVEQFELKNKAVQPLLLPLNIELSYADVVIVNEHMETLKNIGFEVEAFGGNTFAVYGVPQFLIKQDIKMVLLGFIDDMKNQAQKGDVQNRKEKALIYMACRSAVKFGDPLSHEEQVALLKKLQTLALPYTCPHGRPTMITMSFDELERRFGRKY